MIAERFKIAPLLMSLDTSTGLNCTSINMKNLHRVAFLCLLGANGAGAGQKVQVYSAAATATRTTALAFRYAIGSGIVTAASSDVLSAWATAASTGVVIGTTYVSCLLVIEMEAAEITTAGHNWLTVYPSAGTAGAFHCIAIAEPRFKSNVSLTVLT